MECRGYQEGRKPVLHASVDRRVETFVFLSEKARVCVVAVGTTNGSGTQRRIHP